MTEKLEDINMKKVILETWKSKLGYPLNHKDLDELEGIIDYFEGENQELKKQLEEKENQQKEFIEWLENEIKERQIEIVSYHPSSQILIEQIIDIKKMILPKYKEIVGLKEVNND